MNQTHFPFSATKQMALHPLRFVFVVALLSRLVTAQSGLTAASEPENPLHANAAKASVSVSELAEALMSTKGFCLVLGSDFDLDLIPLQKNEGLLVHYLCSGQQQVTRLASRVSDQANAANVICEYWQSNSLPHADNLAGVIVALEEDVDRDEILRVLSPGSAAYIRDGQEFRKILKPRPNGMDSWTHQWHDADGGLTTQDQVGVPQGLQWLSGPLFAMAGRKNSTQSLVSAGGINFYVTQNVLENYGKSEMPQFLVARDAFNGIVLWQRLWTGEFVTGDGETNPRIVVTGARLYVAGESKIIAVDPRSGATLAETLLPSPVDKLAYAMDRLFAQSRNGISAFAENLEKELWKFEAPKTSAMVITDSTLLVLVAGRTSDGRFKHDLVNIDPHSGDLRWSRNTQDQLSAESVRINFADDGLIGLQAHGSLHVYSADDGTHLWSKETDARPGKSYVDERYVGHFYRDGVVWLLQDNSPRTPEGQNRWVGLNARTGEVEKELTTKGKWPRTETPAKMGCQLLIASDRYIMIPRQSTFIDFETGEKLPFKFTRGGCGLGFVPANGLVYSHPHACGCFSEAIRGFMGMHSSSNKPSSPIDDRLYEGPKYGKTVLQDSTESAWPMHRREGSRSGYLDVEIAEDWELAWSAQQVQEDATVSRREWQLRNGSPLTSATSTSDTVFTVDVNQGRVVALDIATGSTKWQFTANGRVNSPPSIYRGLCLFGSHDGYVYCLTAGAGELVWKYRAAPIDRRIIAYGGVESRWPVAGTVLIQDGLAFVAAGRAPDADGGIKVHALDPLSGQTKWTEHVDDELFNGQCDYLIGGDSAVFLSNWKFDALSGESEPMEATAKHLRGGKVGLLETSWTKHDLATRKNIQTWTAQDKTGQLLAFSPDSVAAYHADEHRLEFTGAEDWSTEITAPAQVTSLIMTQNASVVAGGVDRADTHAGGWLKVLDVSSGKVLYDCQLPAEAVFDGLSIAGDKILVATQDGRMHCFETLNCTQEAPH